VADPLEGDRAAARADGAAAQRRGESGLTGTGTIVRTGNSCRAPDPPRGTGDGDASRAETTGCTTTTAVPTKGTAVAFSGAVTSRATAPRTRATMGISLRPNGMTSTANALRYWERRQE